MKEETKQNRLIADKAIPTTENSVVFAYGKGYSDFLRIDNRP